LPWLPGVALMVCSSTRQDTSEADIALHYKLMKLIERRPEISQRELAAELGLSLGKVNYCLKAFIARGLVKVNNFRRSDNKRAYAYLLTPKGIEEKARVTVRFFRRVETEYESLKQEMENLGRLDSGMKLQDQEGHFMSANDTMADLTPKL